LLPRGRRPKTSSNPFFDQKYFIQKKSMKISTPPKKENDVIQCHPMFTADPVSPLGAGLGFRV